MNDIIELQTERLRLRQWCDRDLPVFAQLNADPVVMEFYPAALTAEQSNSMADKLKSLIAEKGWGFWAVEVVADGHFAGFVGLHEPTYELPVTPCVEIGWRLAKEYWGKGYATEAANASLAVAFDKLNQSAVYAFASVSNRKSRAVMERLGMSNTHQNFEHPMIPEHHPLSEHVLYKITKADWLKNNGVGMI
jgi:RimJ/RimL family protein N-acetyltransferase